ncbi:hypothetical protein F4808DRAFT_412111 [Astrocystis sublimbata]|nr:hypothetical protein F4808DRAFT_412111 [Astrocystis sublimbata]
MSSACRAPRRWLYPLIVIPIPSADSLKFLSYHTISLYGSHEATQREPVSLCHGPISGFLTFFLRLGPCQYITLRPNRQALNCLSNCAFATCGMISLSEVFCR